MKKLILPLLIIFSGNILLSAEPQSRKTHAELIQDYTQIMISLYKNLVDNDIITIEHLRKLEKADKLINPLSQEEQYTLSEAQLVRLKGLEAHLNIPIIMSQINTWAKIMVTELEQKQAMHEQTHENTRKIHSQIRFVKIPSGKYVDEVTNETFEIPKGLELQETPITQWQWLKIMDSNPSEFIDDFDTDIVEINSNKIQIRPNVPVENISLEEIQFFIDILNKISKNYTYILPSIGEYQAVMQSVYGTNWLSQVKSQFMKSQTNKTKSVISKQYIGLSNKRLWDLVGNVWQWTRDTVQVGTHSCYAIFGSSYATDGSMISTVKDIIRPLASTKSYAEFIGFRLMRYPRNAIVDVKNNLYETKHLFWDQKDCPLNPGWRWDTTTRQCSTNNDIFRYMFQHKQEYSLDIQHTLDVLLEEAVTHTPKNKDPIQYLLKLNSLNLMSKKLKNLTPLIYLKNLKSLWLHSNEIEDIEPLTSLTNLTYLNLDLNKIQNIEPLAHLNQLTDLSLNDNQIKDIVPLANLINLQNLNLNKNIIKNLSALQYLINLQTLELDENQIQDIDPLLKLNKLKFLKLSSNHIQNIETLKYLTNIVGLFLDNNKIQDISSIAFLTKIGTWGLFSVLSLNNNKISDLKPLINLQNLTSISLSNNQIQDISPLAKLSNLGALDLSNNQIKNIESLSQLTNLETIRLNNNQIQDLKPLKNLPNLYSLELANNRIKDVSPISKLIFHKPSSGLITFLVNFVNLLNLASNQVEDFSPLANISDIDELHISNNPAQNLLPIANMPHLKKLYLDQKQFEASQTINSDNTFMRKCDTNILPRIELVVEN